MKSRQFFLVHFYKRKSNLFVQQSKEATPKFDNMSHPHPILSLSHSPSRLCKLTRNLKTNKDRITLHYFVEILNNLWQHKQSDSLGMKYI